MTITRAQMDYDVPAGFRFAGVGVGIRSPGRPDVGILCTDSNCSAAATFTGNAFCAAPVLASRDILTSTGGKCRGVVVNSGCANAATGKEGMINARQMAATAARETARTGDVAPAWKGRGTEQFLVCSTGTIGVELPMEKIRDGIERAARQLSPLRDAFLDFARSILTTDTCEKIAWERFEHDGRSACILACAKGSGMIHPQMATLLSFTITDAAIDPVFLQECFSRVVDRSLNCLTVDGDTSTNDTAILLANGVSGLEVRRDTPEAALFEQALLRVMQSIAKQLARDGEGATKLIEIEVKGARSFASAHTAAMAVADSCLFKTAVYGRDANWGRIVCALGNSGAEFDPRRVCVRLGPLMLFRLGAPVEFDEETAANVLSEEFVRVEIDLGNGSGVATVWTCDLTEKYIEINGAYRT